MANVGIDPMIPHSLDEPAARSERAATGAYLARLWHSDSDIRVRDEIGRLVHTLLGSLTNGAGKGQESAIVLLLDIVRSGVESLNASANRHRGLYRRIAECRNLWPVLVTPHPDSLAAAGTFVQRIGLGTKTGVGYRNRKAFGWKDEKAIVASLYLELFTRRSFPERYAIRPDEPWDKLISELPVLSRKKNVIEAWWKPILLLFGERYGPVFETHSAFLRHWMSPTFAPKGKPDEVKQRFAAMIYAELTEWWLFGCYGRCNPRVKWPGAPSIYPPMPRGSWQRAAVRLPKLTRRNRVVNAWFEAALLLNRDPVDGYSASFSKAEFAMYMKNAFLKRNKIRKQIKDLLRQALGSIAAEVS